MADEDKKIFVSDETKAAMGPEALNAASSQATTPVAFVSAKDPYKNSQELKAKLDVPAGMDASTLDNKGFQDRVGSGRPSATAPKDETGLCAVSVPDKPDSLGDTFNKIAHVDRNAGAPKLGVDPEKPDPGIAVSHEVGHCGQKPILKNDPKLTETILKAEVDADNKAKAAFPEFAGFVDGARALGGQHDSMGGDVDHSVGLYNASGGKLSADEIAKTHEGLNEKIARNYVSDPKADPERTDAALRYALHDDNLQKPDGQTAGVEAARQQVGRRPAHEILNGMPEETRKAQGIDGNFYSKVAENMPRDPNVIRDQIQKIDPASMSDNEKLAAGIYVDAANKFYPKQPEMSNDLSSTMESTPQPQTQAVRRRPAAGMGM